MPSHLNIRWACFFSRMSNFWWEGTRINKPVSFLNFWSTIHSRKECMEAAIAVIPRRSLLLSHFCVVTSQANYSMSEGLAIVRLKRHIFLPKRRTIQWLPPCTLHENSLVTENPEKRLAHSSAFSLKIWHSRVICVFLRWGLT